MKLNRVSAETNGRKVLAYTGAGTIFRDLLGREMILICANEEDLLSMIAEKYPRMNYSPDRVMNVVVTPDK